MSGACNFSMWVGIWIPMPFYSDTINSTNSDEVKKSDSSETELASQISGTIWTCIILTSSSQNFKLELEHQGKTVPVGRWDWHFQVPFVGLDYEYIIIFFWWQEKFTNISADKRMLKKPAYLVQFVLSAEAVADIKNVSSSQITLNLKC